MSDPSSAASPAAGSEGTPPVLEARKVSIFWRIPVGVLVAIFLGFVFVAVPWVIIPFLLKYDIQAASNIVVLAVLGSGIAFFEGARFVAKPTRAYGPLWICASAAFLGYVLYLAAGATITITYFSNVSIAVGYSLLLLLLAIVPALTLAAAIVTTVEDRRHPGERLPFDFPVRRFGRKRKA